MPRPTGRGICLKKMADMSANKKAQAAATPLAREYHIPELVVGYADSPADLGRQTESWLKATKDAPEKSGFLKHLARDTQNAFNRRSHDAAFRAAATAYTEREFEKKVRELQKMIIESPDSPFSFPEAGLFYGCGPPIGRTAFLFPGQGAQYLGMGSALAKTFPTASRVWEGLGATQFDGKTIKEVVFPKEAVDEQTAQKAFLRLSGADWTNPCISVVGEAVYQLFAKMGLHPDAVAAHSFGDISAYRAAGILGADDMIKATRYRGELGVACPLATRGCILIVAESAEKTVAIIEENELKEVWIANYNTPSQTVLSGVKEAVYKAHSVFEAAGIDSRPLPISAAPHCPLAVDVAEKFFQYLTGLDFKQAECDVYSFLFGRKVNNDPALFRKLLKAHIEKPVRFLSQTKQMYEDGIRIFIEIGPSGILTNLVGQILADKPHIALCTDKKKEDAVLVFLNAVAELFKEGGIKNLDVLWEGYEKPGFQADITSQEFPDEEADAQTEKRLKKLDLALAKIENERTTAGTKAI